MRNNIRYSSLLLTGIQAAICLFLFMDYAMGGELCFIVVAFLGCIGASVLVFAIASAIRFESIQSKLPLKERVPFPALTFCGGLVMTGLSILVFFLPAIVR